MNKNRLKSKCKVNKYIITNDIDLMIEIGYDFKQAVCILEKWLRQYKTGTQTVAARKTGIIHTRYIKNRPVGVRSIVPSQSK